jgi:hypothetical protein
MKMLEGVENTKYKTLSLCDFPLERKRSKGVLVLHINFFNLKEFQVETNSKGNM